MKLNVKLTKGVYMNADFDVTNNSNNHFIQEHFSQEKIIGASIDLFAIDTPITDMASGAFREWQEFAELHKNELSDPEFVAKHVIVAKLHEYENSEGKGNQKITKLDIQEGGLSRLGGLPIVIHKKNKEGKVEAIKLDPNRVIIGVLSAKEYGRIMTIVNTAFADAIKKQEEQKESDDWYEKNKHRMETKVHQPKVNRIVQDRISKKDSAINGVKLDSRAILADEIKKFRKHEEKRKEFQEEQKEISQQIVHEENTKDDIKTEIKNKEIRKKQS